MRIFGYCRGLTACAADLGYFWKPLGIIRGPFWEHFGDLLGTIWGNGEHLKDAVDLKKMFYDRHNFYISFRAFAPFKSIKPAVQLGELLCRLQKNRRLFWTTRAGVKKAWWDSSFASI